MKKDATTESKAQTENQSSEKTTNQETMETGLPEEKSPDDMEIFD